MKKILAILLALALCLSAAFAAEINWADVADQAAEMAPSAQFWTLNAVNCKIWIPDVLQYIELSEDDIDAGYIAYWCTEDGSAAVGVQYVNMDGTSLEEYAAWLTENGFTVEEGVLNGLSCISYSWVSEEGVASNVVSFTTAAGYILEFSFTAGDEGYEVVSAFIAASIQAAE